MPISQTEDYFKKTLVAIFRGKYALSVCIKMKPLRKTLSKVETKTNSSFAVNFAEMLKETTIQFCQFDE